MMRASFFTLFPNAARAGQIGALIRRLQASGAIPISPRSFKSTAVVFNKVSSERVSTATYLLRFKRRLGTGAPEHNAAAIASKENAVQHAAKVTLTRYREFEDYMRWHGYNTLRIVAGFFGAMAVLIYFNRDPIRDNISQEVAGVTRRSLEQRELIDRANELTKEVVHGVLVDPRIAANAGQFVVDLFQQPETQQATSRLVQWVLQDETTRKAAQDFSVWLVSWLAKDPVTQTNLSNLVVSMMRRKDIQQVTVDLVRRVLADPDTRRYTAEIAAEVMTFDVVRQASVDLGMYTSHQVLDDVEVQKHTSRFFSDCLSSPDLQEQAGNAIWNAVSYSVTPRFSLGWKSRQAAPDAKPE